MSASCDPELMVLHALRLKAVAPEATVAAVVGIDGDEATAVVHRLAEQGWARHRAGVPAGWSLTPTGRVEHGRRLADELRRAGVGDRIEAAYARFLELNPELLALCTDWQLVPASGSTPTRNDHGDAGYDEAVLARLRRLDEHAQPLCAELTAALARFGGYGPRLATALERTLAGDVEWLDRPVIDSYHTVWFELHEDLLVTLGRQRSQERSA